MTKYGKFSLLILTLIILVCTVFTGCSEEADNAPNTDDERVESSCDSDNTAPSETLTASASLPNKVDESTTQESESSAAESASENIVDPSVFDRSLFVGDSRTVGLSQYADLGGADVFATSGLNIFRLKSEVVNVSGHGDITLDALLTVEKYEKIYLMLGINEIGYNHSFVIKKFGEVLEHIKEMSPDSEIVLCANLHIVQKRSEIDDVYNNAGINELNEGIKSFADGDKVVYLDVNPLFDDENGALNEAYAVDDFHLVGEYYEQWGRWLAAQCAESR